MRKRCAKGIGILLAVFLLGWVAKLVLEPKEYEHIDFISGIAQDECFLCADQGLREDNVGILNLNTFEVYRLEICRYDDHGEVIRETCGFAAFGGIHNVHASAYPDDGYASVRISDVTYTIDREMVQSRLCQTCLDSINSLWFDGSPPAEFAVMSFEDRTVRPLIKNTTWFSSGNYGINCEFRENGDIDLLIHYLSPPYA